MGSVDEGSVIEGLEADGGRIGDVEGLGMRDFAVKEDGMETLDGAVEDLDIGFDEDGVNWGLEEDGLGLDGLELEDLEMDGFTLAGLEIVGMELEGSELTDLKVVGLEPAGLIPIGLVLADIVREEWELASLELE